MKDDLRYTPTDCFETFPFPAGWETDAALEAAGREYYEARAALMVSHHEGLTKTYNRFHDPAEDAPGIHRLRRLHAALDHAVLAAYGWSDLVETGRCACEFLPAYYDEPEQEGGAPPPQKHPPPLARRHKRRSPRPPPQTQRRTGSGGSRREREPGRTGSSGETRREACRKETHAEAEYGGRGARAGGVVARTASGLFHYIRVKLINRTCPKTIPIKRCSSSC